MRGLNGTVVGGIRLALLVLLGAVGLVLLIACANVANLTLASGRCSATRGRDSDRTRRRALAARSATAHGECVARDGRWSARLAIAWWGLHTLLGASRQRAAAQRLDWNSGRRFAVRRGDLARNRTWCWAHSGPPREPVGSCGKILSDAAGRSSASAARHRTLKSLIAAEIALSVVLLTGAGLVIRSVAALLEVDAGFRAEGVLTFTVSRRREARIADTLRYSQFYGPVLDRLRALPGVRAAGNDEHVASAGRNDRSILSYRRATGRDRHHPSA